jgi:probable rRNA maturation factor
MRSIYRRPWRIDVDVRDAVILPASVASLVRAVSAALAAAGAPAPASIGLILSDDAELAELNATHMGKAGPTDVLSFPLLAPEAFASGAPIPDEPKPPGSRLHLGDVVVSVERARVQAEAGLGGQTGDVRWSPADELRLLVTHGTLHICGWDHAEPAEEAAMRALEQRLLAGSGSGGHGGLPRPRGGT